MMPWLFDTIGLAMLAFLTMDRVAERLNQRTDQSVEQVKRIRVVMVVGFLVVAVIASAGILHSRILADGTLDPAQETGAVPCGAEKPTSHIRK